MNSQLSSKTTALIKVLNQQIGFFDSHYRYVKALHARTYIFSDTACSKPEFYVVLLEDWILSSEVLQEQIVSPYPYAICMATPITQLCLLGDCPED